jgi:hypothetical protein
MSDSEVFCIMKYNPLSWQTFTPKYMTDAERKTVVAAMKGHAGLATDTQVSAAMRNGASWCTWGYIDTYENQTGNSISKIFPLGTPFYALKCNQTSMFLDVARMSVPMTTPVSPSVTTVSSDINGNLIFYGKKPHPDRPVPTGATWSTRFLNKGKNVIQFRLNASAGWVYEIVPFNERQYFEKLENNYISSYAPREFEASAAGNEMGFIVTAVLSAIIGLAFVVAGLYYRSKVQSVDLSVSGGNVGGGGVGIGGDFYSQ